MNENAARLAWAGAGIRVPRRFTSDRVVRLAVERTLDDVELRARAREFGRWASEHDAGEAAARLVEELAGRRRRAGFARATPTSSVRLR
jgi:UDP:flavonoid glycosyltransferase YjiC (YdhE family)